MILSNKKVAVIGLGYVGLPLAVEFARKRSVVGFDINQKRIDELRNGHDNTLEVSGDELLAVDALKLTADVDDLAKCNLYIVTVPTPIDAIVGHASAQIPNDPTSALSGDGRVSESERCESTGKANVLDLGH